VRVAIEKDARDELGLAARLGQVVRGLAQWRASARNGHLGRREARARPCSDRDLADGSMRWGTITAARRALDA
jgi:hypothetical protein